MAKNTKLYRSLRSAGLRKKTARELSRMPKGGPPTTAQRQALGRVEQAVADLQGRAGLDDGPRTADEMLEVSDIRRVGVRG